MSSLQSSSCNTCSQALLCTSSYPTLSCNIPTLPTSSIAYHCPVTGPKSWSSASSIFWLTCQLISFFSLHEPFVVLVKLLYTLFTELTVHRIVWEEGTHIPPLPVLFFFHGLSSFFPGQVRYPSWRKSFMTTFRNQDFLSEIRDQRRIILHMGHIIHDSFLVFPFMDSLLPFKMHCKGRRQRELGLLFFFSNASIPQCFCTQWVLSGRFLICYKVGFCIWHVYMYLTF